MVKEFISSKENPWYSLFREVYEYSFPLHEQRTEEQQQIAFNNPEYHLEIHTEGETFLSFISYWEFNDYIYIEHLAVNRECRGNNIGSRLLQEFTSGKDKTVLLEIDPLTDEIACRRLEFYKRNGFTDNPYPHFHPPYRTGFKPHELIVLSHGNPISQELYNTFNEDLKNVVMKF